MRRWLGGTNGACGGRRWGDFLDGLKVGWGRRRGEMVGDDLRGAGEEVGEERIGNV